MDQQQSLPNNPLAPLSAVPFMKKGTTKPPAPPLNKSPEATTLLNDDIIPQPNTLFTKPSSSGDPTRKSSIFNKSEDFWVKLSKWRQERLVQLKPWREFVSEITVPPSDPELLRLRIQRNFSYFTSNYVVVGFVLLAYCMYVRENLKTHKSMSEKIFYTIFCA